MAFDESEENINKALAELDAIRNNLNRLSNTTDQIYRKFEMACEIFKCVGEIDTKSMVEDRLDGFYDSSNNALTNYFLVGGDKHSHSGISKLITFFLNQRGTSEQFALALSMVFANDKNIRTFPIRIKIKLKNDEMTAETYSFANLVQLIDDDGILINSYYVDLFNNTKPHIEYSKMLDELTNKLTNDNQVCLYAEIDSINYFEQDLDLKANFEILEKLTTDGELTFNYDGYNFDITNAAVENCINIENYASKKELQEHLSNYIKPEN